MTKPSPELPPAALDPAVPPLPAGVQVPTQRTAPPPSTAMPAQRQNGFGTTALVCACVGIALNLSPMFYVLGVLSGVVAVVFGVLAVRRARPDEASNKRTAIAATVVGGVAIVLGVVQGTVWAISTATPPPAPSATAPVPQTTAPAPTATAPTITIPTPVGPPQAITARTWQLIAKDPAAHVGKHVIVYGHVTQFDAATGTYGFRASADGVVHKPQYGYVDYPTNTVFIGEPSLLTNLVQGDLFRAEVTVMGPYSYATQIGGQTTVPQLAVNKVTVTGSLTR